MASVPPPIAGIGESTSSASRHAAFSFDSQGLSAFRMSGAKTALAGVLMVLAGALVVAWIWLGDVPA